MIKILLEYSAYFKIEQLIILEEDFKIKKNIHNENNILYFLIVNFLNFFIY